MVEAHGTADVERGDRSGGVGLGWRVFQVLALGSALAWLYSYFAIYAPGGAFTWVGPLFDGQLPAYGDVVFDISPVVSVLVVLLALWPSSLRALQGRSKQAYALRAIAFIIPALWMVNVFVGTPMVDKLIGQPLNESRMVPVYGGVFLHVVLQHWFQSIAAIAFTLVPEQFDTLTASETPAGLQCAVVDCS